MAGKKRRAKSKDGRGGKREGAGRPPASKEEARLKQMITDLRKWEEETGKTINDELLRIFFMGRKISVKDKIMIARLFNECTIPRQSQKDVTVRNPNQGPLIFSEEEYEKFKRGEFPAALTQGKIILPEMKPDPAKVVPLELKKASKN